MEKKKKSIIIGAVVAAVVLIVVLCFVCCHKSVDKYCSAIPQDAVVIARVDVAGFVSKHDIDLDGLKKSMGDMDELFENPGVDVSKPIYGFVTPKGAMGLVAKMQNSENLKSVVKTFGRMTGAKLSEKQGYNWIEFGEVLVCFDDNKLLALSGAGMYARKEMVKLMEQDEDESVLDTKLFESVTNVSQPFAIVTNIKQIPDIAGMDIKGAMAASAQLLGIEPSDFDVNIVQTLDVVKDKAVYTLRYEPLSDALKEKMDEFSTGMGKITGKYINTIVDDPVIWGCTHLEGDKYTKMMKDVVDSQMALLKTLDTNGMAESIMNSAMKAIESLNGDINFVVPSLEEPNFLLQAEVKDNALLSLFDVVSENSNGMVPVMKTNNNNYTIAIDEMVMLSGVKDNLFYFTNSTDMTAKLGKEVDSRINDLKSDICNSNFYLTVDAQTLVGIMMQTSSMRMLLTSYFGRLAQLDRLVIRNVDNYGVEISLSTRDGKDFVKTMFK